MRRETLMTQPLTTSKQDASDPKRFRLAGFMWTMSRKTLATSLGTAAIVGALSFSSLSVAGSNCDAYVPSCGGGVCDCGSCDMSEIESSCDCGNCGSKKRFKNNPLIKSLDFVAGGIEKALGLDRCGTSGCGTSSCDGCDSCGCAGGGDVSYDVTPIPHSTHITPAPLNAVPTPLPPTPAPMLSAPRVVQPRLPSVPPLESAPRQAQPRVVQPRVVQPRMTQPRIVEPLQDSGPTFSEPRTPAPRTPEPRSLDRVPEREAPAEVPVPDANSNAPDPFKSDAFPADPAPMPVPEKSDDGGSIFDALDSDDPFKDDEVRLRRPYGSVRPTGLKRYETKKRSLQQQDPRQTKSSQQRVGSGLRPVSHSVPVSQASGLKPMGGGRTLAPYRQSR